MMYPRQSPAPWAFISSLFRDDIEGSSVSPNSMFLYFTGVEPSHGLQIRKTETHRTLDPGWICVKQPPGHHGPGLRRRPNALVAPDVRECPPPGVGGTRPGVSEPGSKENIDRLILLYFSILFIIDVFAFIVTC